MDFHGPLYDVRMSRGQGFNSYIQEPRLYDAVKIKALQNNSSVKPREEESATGDGGQTEHVAPDPKASSEPSNPDLVRMILDEMRKNNPWAPATDESKKLPYLKPTPTGKANQTVLFSSKQVKNATEIDQAMGAKASAAVKAAAIGPGAELGSNISTSDDFKGDAINFLVTVKVVNEKPDRQEEYIFREVEHLKTRLSNIYCESCRKKDQEKERDGAKDHVTAPKPPTDRVIPEDVQVLERERARPPCHTCGHKRAIEFTRIYGDTFISDFVEGGEIYALINIRSASKTKLKDLKAYASAQLTPAAVPIKAQIDTEFTKSGKEAWDQAETSIRVQWRGGGEIKTHDFQWGLESLVQVANAFPTFVAATSAKIRAVLTPYSALEEFQQLQNIFPAHTLTLNYERCALFVDTLYEDYKAFRSMWDDLNMIIEYPERYIERKVPQEKDLTRQKPDPGQQQRLLSTGGSLVDLRINAPDRRINSSSSSVSTSHRMAQAESFLTKIVHKAKSPAPKRRGATLRVIRPRADRTPIRGFIPDREDIPGSSTVHIASNTSEITNRKARDAARSRNADDTLHAPSAAVEVEQSISSVSGDEIPPPGQTTAKPADPNPFAVALTNLNDILTTKESDDLKLIPLRPNETQKLSKLRLVCRFAMLHIQDLAADLVLDPQNTNTNFGRRNSGVPMFTQPLYPYPATIRAILPVKPDSGKNKPNYGAWHYTCVEDLRFPESMKDYPGSPYPDDYTYWWDVYGELSKYKHYEYFQLGNFDPTNEDYPQAIAFQSNPARAGLAGTLSRRARDDENSIAGIALRYAADAAPAPPYNDLENHVLDGGGSGSGSSSSSRIPVANPNGSGAMLYHAVCGGKAPSHEDQWTAIPWSAPDTAAPFNRVNVYHAQGSGRVAGMEIYRDDEGGDGEVFFDSLRQGVPLAGHRSWEGRRPRKDDDGRPEVAPPQYNCVPGDGFSKQRLWMFAGFVGAFERVGVLGRGERALAKVAVVWKRRASQMSGEGDG